MNPEYDIRESGGFLPIERIGIIGKNGQIGGMLSEVLAGSEAAIVTAGRGEISSLMATQPEVVFLATPNPVGETIKEVLAAIESPTTVVLLQNGVGVVDESLPLVEDTPVTLLRAGIFIPVAKDGDALVYNERKLRIALAPIPGMPIAKNYAVASMLEKSGFTVRLYEDYRSLEWTKLLLNCLGSTSTVTGLTPYETFTDAELFAWEIRGVRDRIAVMRHLGIPIAPIPWGKTGLLTRAAPWVPEHPIAIVQRTIAQIISKGRENMPSSAARKIATGSDISEVLEYHRPFMHMSPIDEALFTVILGHQKQQYSLREMSPKERRQKLREYVSAVSRK